MRCRRRRGGVLVHLPAEPVHSVARIEFRARWGCPRAACAADGRRRFGETPPGRPCARRGAERCSGCSADHGYVRASVRAAPKFVHNPDRTTLVVRRSRPGRAPASAMVDDRGRSADDPGRVSSPSSARRPDAPYAASAVQPAARSYVTELRRRRLLRGDATLHRVESDDGTQVTLVDDDRPGPAGHGAFDGDPLPKDRLKSSSPIESEGSVERGPAGGLRARGIENYLRQQGYWKARGHGSQREEATDADVVFTVMRARRIASPRRRRDFRHQAIPIDGAPAARRARAGRTVFVESQLPTR